MAKKGIDISHHQGDIDWDLTKNEIEFAIIRCGYGIDKVSQDDLKYKRNAEMCTKYGIPFGVYLFSYARSDEEASSEADHVLRLIKGYNLKYPVYYDVESNDYINQNSNEQLVRNCEIFCKKIEAAGYYVGIYSDKHFLTTKLNSNSLDKYDKWLAQWSSKPTYNGYFGLWQYTSDGAVSGINGRVDMNIAYLDYPKIIGDRGLNNSNNDNPEKPSPIVPLPDNRTYVVKAGDNLSNIALKYKTTVSELVKLNNIKNANLIHPGQVLKLPNGTSEPIIYIVKKGDNLSKIASKFNTNWKTIYEKNKTTIGSNPSKIYAGQKLFI